MNSVKSESVTSNRKRRKYVDGRNDYDYIAFGIYFYVFLVHYN